MKLVPVTTIPETVESKKYEHPVDVISDFANSPNKYAKVASQEYASVAYCISVLRHTINRNGYSMKVIQRGKDIYLSKD